MGSCSQKVIGRFAQVALCVFFSIQAGFGHGEKGEIGGSSGGGSSNSVDFPAHNIEVLGHLSLADMGGDGDRIRGNDIWGWTDPETGKEYALVGRTDGVSFVDITTPRNPVYLGMLPRTTGSEISVWRDMKTYRNRVYVVADNSDNGLQIFDLTELRGVTNPPRIFSETARYDGFKQAHNIAINESTGFAYPVGAFGENEDKLWNNGLVFLNLNLEPHQAGFLAGGYGGDGYTHDVQVVNYHGADQRYLGDEVAFAANEDTLTIVNLRNKGAPELLSRRSYSAVAYTHQGWLTEDHRYFLSNDELDEIRNPNVSTTRTHIWKLENLQSPEYFGFYDHGTIATDHNLYVHKGMVYEANYTTGLRVLSVERIDEGTLEPVAWVDTHPSEDELGFEGAWSVYPFFESGSVIISDVNEGLVIARLTTPGYSQDLARWKESYFASDDLAKHTLESTVWGHDVDFDKDGLSNFLEFAFDTDPTKPDFSEYPEIGTDEIANPDRGGAMEVYVTLSFLRRKGIDYLNYEPVSTNRLSEPDWQANFVAYKTESTEKETIERVSYRSMEPIEEGASSPPVFVRLRVNRPEPL